MNQTMEESVLGVIPHMKLKTGLFSSKEFTLVVTNQRVIFARLSKEMVKETHQEAVEKFNPTPSPSRKDEAHGLLPCMPA